MIINVQMIMIKYIIIQKKVSYYLICGDHNIHDTGTDLYLAGGLLKST
jgi:hypothetical protein